ncbi:MAG TPA: RHS repeat-associated core domain-containing protein [Ktedonobacteraceae bacterium]|nr:RHS repeat-associated core domain-containing protein [Ktedonobacteraceae bacterium]
MPNYTQAYSYDDLDRISSSAAGTYTYGDANHLHAATGVSSIANPYAAYDAMGNICRNVDTTTGHTCGGSIPTGALMSYDAQGRMVNWNAPSGTVGSAHSLYDNQGNRVLTNASNASSTTDTVYFDGYTETVLSGGTTTTTTYYSLNGSRIAARVGSTLSYLVRDPLGSNTIALSSTGQVSALQHYSPYGTVDYTWGSMPTSFSYTGQRLDSQTGLLYDTFRSYDPISGRFVRADTVQNNTSGMDPYAYVGDNPETRNDPSGHSATSPDGFNDPWLVYVGAFYQFIHPGDWVIVDSAEDPGYTVPGGSTAGTGNDGYVDIANLSQGIIWDAKTGGGTGETMGDWMPDMATTVPTGAAQAQMYVNKLNAAEGGGWRVGSVNPINPPSKNDIPLMITLALCGGQCQFGFGDGLEMALKVPVDGVLAYSVTRRPDGGRPASNPKLVRVWSRLGSWSAEEFLQQIKQILSAGPLAIALYMAGVAAAMRGSIPIPPIAGSSGSTTSTPEGGGWEIPGPGQGGDQLHPA